MIVNIKKRKGISIVIILITLICIWRIIYVNNHYKTPKFCYYNSEDRIEHNGTEISVLSVKIFGFDRFVLKYKDIINGFNKSNPGYLEKQKYEKSVVLIELHIKNTAGVSDNVAYANSATIYAEGMVNGKESYMESYINKNKQFNLKKGVDDTFTLMFHIPKNLVSQRMWRNIENLQYKLVFSDMDEVSIIDLGILEKE